MLTSFLLALLIAQPATPADTSRFAGSAKRFLAGNRLIIVSLGNARSRATPTKAVVLFENQLQLWEKNRYKTYWQFAADRGQKLPNGEYTLVKTEIVDPRSAPPFCLLTLEDRHSTEEYRIRVYWRPYRLYKWLELGSRVEYPACLL